MVIGMELKASMVRRVGMGANAQPGDFLLYGKEQTKVKVWRYPYEEPGKGEWFESPGLIWCPYCGHASSLVQDLTGDMDRPTMNPSLRCMECDAHYTVTEGVISPA